MHLLRALLALSLSFSITLTHADSVPLAQQKLVDQLLEENNSKSVIGMLAQKLSYEILESAQKKRSNKPSEDFVRLIEQETKKAVYEDFILNNKFNDIFYGLYDEYFTLEELKEILAFQRSDAGRKLRQYMPIINEQSFQIAKEQASHTGKKIHERLIKRLQEVEKKLDTETTESASE